MLKSILKIIWFRNLVRQHFFAVKKIVEYDDQIVKIKLKIGFEGHSGIKKQLDILFDKKHEWEGTRNRCMDIIGDTLKKKI